MTAASVPFFPLDDPELEKRDRRKGKKSLATVALMHLRRAARLGKLKTSDPENVAIAGFNALTNSIKASGLQPDPDLILPLVSKLVLAAGHRIADERLLEIYHAEEKFGRLDVEGFGELLDLDPADRVKHKLWTLGAKGQSRDQRIAEKDERKAARRERYNAARREARAAAPKKTKLKDQRPWEALGISERTWRRRQADEVGRKNSAHNIGGRKQVIRAAKTATPLGDRPEGRPPAECAEPRRTSSPAHAEPAQVGFTHSFAFTVMRLAARLQRIGEELLPPERIRASIEQINAKPEPTIRSKRSAA